MISPQPLLHKLMPLAIALAASGWSGAAVTYFDPDDIIIPFDFGGVYLDITTGDESSSSSSGEAQDSTNTSGSYTISYSEPASWDLNFFFGGAGIAHSNTINLYRDSNSDILSAIHNVAADITVDGQPIDPQPPTGPSQPLTTVSFGGSGTGTGGGIDGLLTPTHMGTAANQFSGGSEGFIAFVLDPGGPGQQFGWIRVTLNDNGSTGLIHDWAYSDSPLDVGQVPEPGSLTLLAIATLVLVRRRR